jgi:uncharacterized DUF497 family protein
MLTTRFERFDWDADNRGKCQAHGVSIAEIESALLLDDMLVVHDAKYSQDERAGRTAIHRRRADAFRSLPVRSVYVANHRRTHGPAPDHCPLHA